MCERAVHVYEAVEHFSTVQVSQPHLEQGLFSIPHQWQTI
jgi:lipopolysaccharide transport system ATP-binding protein